MLFGSLDCKGFRYLDRQTQQRVHEDPLFTNLLKNNQIPVLPQNFCSKDEYNKYQCCLEV